MGRRYRSQFANRKDLITYHVYENNQLVKSFAGNKQAAQELANTLNGNVEIKKTREQTGN